MIKTKKVKKLKLEKLTAGWGSSEAQRWKGKKEKYKSKT
jgi:hypothetical protein